MAMYRIKYEPTALYSGRVVFVKLKVIAATSIPGSQHTLT